MSGGNKAAPDQQQVDRTDFAGLAKPEDRLAASREYVQQMSPRELPPRIDWPQVLRFQGYAIPYGIAAEFEIGWYSQLLHQLEEQP